jgi:hypothetical protein
MKPKFEEGVTCLDCGRAFEAELLVYGSLYGQKESLSTWEGLDPFCPVCHQDNLIFHKPAEDSVRAERSES